MEIKEALGALSQMQQKLFVGKSIFPDSVQEVKLDELVAFVNDISDDIATYERIVTEYDATLAAQHDRIAELEAQLAAALTTIEAAAQSGEWATATIESYQISENQRLDAIPEATGKDYAEGCAP